MSVDTTPSVHERGIVDYFGLKNCIYNCPTTIFASCTVLLFVNRSGSNILGNYLTATGLFHGFQENLNCDTVIAFSSKHNVKSFRDYIARVAQRIQHNEQSEFGIKASWRQVAMLIRFQFIPAFSQRINWIYIKRNDLVDQAISLSIAQQNRRWASFQPGNNKDPVFDYDDIDAKIREIQEQYEGTEKLIRLLGINPIRLTYEEFIEEPRRLTRRVCALLKKPFCDIDEAKIVFEKQRGELNCEFRDRYLRIKQSRTR